MTTFDRAPTAPSDQIDLTVLVPVTERPAPLDALYREFAPPLRDSGYRLEFLFVVNPQLADRADPLRQLAAAGEPVRVLRVAQPWGEATLLRVGAEAARGETVLILPAYRRVEASALAGLMACLAGGAQVAVARRWPRRDGLANRAQSAVFNGLLRGLVRRRFHDVASGVAVLPRTVLSDLPLYGDFARFLPLIAERAGFRVEEVPCPQHPDDARRRLHGPGVYVRRLIDVLGVLFLVRFTEKPLRFFGLVGGVLFVAGAVLLAVLAAQKLEGQDIANRPMLLLAVLLVVLGVHAIALGLIGEIIVHLQVARRPGYRLADDPGGAGPEPGRAGGSAPAG